jgi:hypothetical protein
MNLTSPESLALAGRHDLGYYADKYSISIDGTLLSSEIASFVNCLLAFLLCFEIHSQNRMS